MVERSGFRPLSAVPAAEAAADLMAALRQILEGVDRLEAAASPQERQLRARAESLIDRLAKARFQLSVVGQFKRGKSSLVNALLAADVLPTGILPLTAIATFIGYASAPGLKIQFEGGRSQTWSPGGIDSLTEVLTSFVSEASNPHNTKGVARVEVSLPSAFLANGLIVIDTPGVGSTLQHNTAAAEAAIPESDAALLVVSPDPPITQVEIDYLRRVRASAAVVVVALNKSDGTEAGDRELALAFLKTTLDAAGFGDADVLPVSARTARRAQMADDAAALAASGLSELRERLEDLATKGRDQVFNAAIAQKAAAVLGDWAFENGVALSALTLPLETLDERLKDFSVASAQFQIERQAVADQLQGDRKRLFEHLDEDAAALRERAGEQLNERVAALVHEGATPGHAWDKVRLEIGPLFDEALATATEAARQRLETQLQLHQARVDGLLSEIRRAAAKLLDAPFHAPAASEAYGMRDRPYWVAQPRESLSAPPLALIEKLLPGPLARRRAARRVAGEIDQVVTANVEHLRWSTRQNLDESIRQFGLALDRTLAQAVAAVTDAVTTAGRLRRSGSQRVEVELQRRREMAILIDKLRRDLDLGALPEP